MKKTIHEVLAGLSLLALLCVVGRLDADPNASLLGAALMGLAAAASLAVNAYLGGMMYSKPRR